MKLDSSEVVVIAASILLGHLRLLLQMSQILRKWCILYILQTFAPVVAGHSSQGASAYQIYHYSQLLNNNEFSAFDNGEVLNLQEYDRPSPPPYNLTQISCKVAIHHSEDDWLATLPDVTQLKNQLSNVVDYAKISQDGFSHYDYLLSQNVQGLVYDRLVSNCAKYGQYVTYQ